MDQQSTNDFQLDYLLSYLMALSIKARWGHCYENAFAAYFAFPHIFDCPGSFLVEGWIVFETNNTVVLMEHGYCLSGKRIVDPTIVTVVNPQQPGLAQPVWHFPGILRDRSELTELENQFFPHVRFSTYGEDGLGHPGYLKAYETARQKAIELLSSEKTLVEVKATFLESEGKQ